MIEVFHSYDLTKLYDRKIVQNKFILNFVYSANIKTVTLLFWEEPI